MTLAMVKVLPRAGHSQQHLGRFASLIPPTSVMASGWSPGRKNDSSLKAMGKSKAGSLWIKAIAELFNCRCSNVAASLPGSDE